MRRRNNTHKLALVAVLVFLMVGMLFSPHGAAPAKAQSCSWGDIICDMQQAIQQLLDSYVNPMIDQLKLQANKALYGLLYNFAHNIAAFMWSISKALTTVGVGVGIVIDWISESFFQPMIQMTGSTMQPIVNVFFVIAFAVLGLTYLLSSLIRLNVVSPRNMLLWWIAGALFFSIASSFYSSMRNLNQSLNSLFYAASIDTMAEQQPFSALSSSDPAADDPVFSMTELCNNFTAYLPGSEAKINGMDVSLAFQKADGFDVVGNGDPCLGGPFVYLGNVLPRKWMDRDGFFDAEIAPGSWPDVLVAMDWGMCSTPAECMAACGVATEEELAKASGCVLQYAIGKMQTTVNQAFAGISREWQSIPLVWFSIAEQLVLLCIIVAQGLTFITFGCAMVFAFFRRTEPIAWAVLDQWIALIVQSIVIALLQALVVALYISAAQSGSPLVSIAVSVVGLVFMVILLISGLRAVWSAFNRLFEAFGQASGGTIVTPAAAGMAALQATSAVASGGLSVAAGSTSLISGASAVGQGATWAQAAGLVGGGSRALDGAAYQMARLPGLRDTVIGNVANQYIEGSAARRAGESLLGAIPGVGDTLGKLGGASVGAALLTDRSASHEVAKLDDDGTLRWTQPTLNPKAGSVLQGMLTSPRWVDGSESYGQSVANLRHTNGEPLRRVDAQAEAPVSGMREERFYPLNKDNNGAKTVSLDNAGNLDETIAEDMKRSTQATEASHEKRLDSDPIPASQMANAAQRLSIAGEGLVNAADALRRSTLGAEAQRRMEQVEGRVVVSGSNNIASVLERAIDQLRKDNAATGQIGATNERVSAALAGAMDIQPARNDAGQQADPIEGRVHRFQMFVDQALHMGLSGAQAQDVIREVKANPDGRLSPQTRERLVHQQHEDRNEAWEDSVRMVRELENAARLLPNQVSAHGVRLIPVSTKQQVDVTLNPPQSTPIPEKTEPPSQSAESMMRRIMNYKSQSMPSSSPNKSESD